jgi:hypothetical protein
MTFMTWLVCVLCILLSIVAGIGISVALGPVGKLRHFGWRGSLRSRVLCLLLSLSYLILFGWLVLTSY